jgi:hypothetical protein
MFLLVQSWSWSNNNVELAKGEGLLSFVPDIRRYLSAIDRSECDEEFS